MTESKQNDTHCEPALHPRDGVFAGGGGTDDFKFQNVKTAHAAHIPPVNY